MIAQVSPIVNPKILRLLSTLDIGGEVENDGLCHLVCVRSERESGLRHQYLLRSFQIVFNLIRSGAFTTHEVSSVDKSREIPKFTPGGTGEGTSFWKKPVHPAHHSLERREQEQSEEEQWCLIFS
jgi:hypothetical protein